MQLGNLRKLNLFAGCLHLVRCAFVIIILIVIGAFLGSTLLVGASTTAVTWFNKEDVAAV